MTPEGGSSGAERNRAPESPGEPQGRRKLLEDIALLSLATAILVVPAWLRSTPAGPLRLEDRPPAPVRIDINRAPWYEWMLLEGIGEARARAIVEFRDSNGPFRSVDELKRVPRMPPGWVERSRAHLEVRG